MTSVNGESGFFTENQSGVNPHKSLSYEQSAQVIISHITDGLKLAEKHNLPKVIKDFISTHHGRGLTKYFYISYKTNILTKKWIRKSSATPVRTRSPRNRPS